MEISQKFYSLTGFFIVIGSLIAAVGHILKPAIPKATEGIEQYISQTLLSDTLLVLGLPLVILGLVGLFVRQAGALKWWGWIGYPLTGIGLIFADIIQPVIRLTAYPLLFDNTETEAGIYKAATTIFDQDPFGYFTILLILSVIGPIWSAISFWKAKIFPVWMAIMLMLILPMFIIAPMLGIDNFPAYLYIVFGIYGVRLIVDKNHAAGGSIDNMVD